MIKLLRSQSIARLQAVAKPEIAGAVRKCIIGKPKEALHSSRRRRREGYAVSIIGMVRNSAILLCFYGKNMSMACVWLQHPAL